MADHSSAYSERAFRAKLGEVGGLKQVFEAAKKLHGLLTDPATPVWVKAMCVAALGYLILPTDVVTDFIPALGYGDDLMMLTSAMAAIAARWRQVDGEATEVGSGQ